MRKYTSNQLLIDFLLSNGYKHVHNDSDKKYYVNSYGNQIRIDYSYKLVALINKHGYVVEEVSYVTEDRLLEFSVSDNIVNT